MSEPYWGILCRDCEERIVFGLRGDPDTGDIATFLQPGYFTCLRGHRNPYFNDDVVFFKDIGAISNAAMRKNRAKYVRMTRPK
jgi:hypothetical protein